jgi:hypothetical protein
MANFRKTSGRRIANPAILKYYRKPEKDDFQCEICDPVRNRCATDAKPAADRVTSRVLSVPLLLLGIYDVIGPSDSSCRPLGAYP